MKKIIRTVCIAAIALFAIPQQADAQFFKKLKEAAKGVVQEVTGTTTTGTASTTTTAQNAPSVSYLPSASGVLVGNPGSKYFTLEFVEAKGSKGSNRVDIYVKVKAVSLSIQNALVGGAGLTKAYDADGNEYGAGCDYDDKKNLNPDVAVKLKFATICEVPSTVTSFVLVKGPWNLSGGRNSSPINEYIQLKNVPIVWE